MKRRHAIGRLTASTLVVIGGSRTRTAGAAVLEPGQLVHWPEVSLLDGGVFGPAQAAGRPVVVVFWSTTCPFCRRHNQHVEKLHRAAASRSLNVLGVARDKDPEAVRLAIRQQGYTFPITVDSAPMAAALSARNVIPLTVVVDSTGRLRQIYPGEMFEEDVLELLNKLAPLPEVRS